MKQSEIDIRDKVLSKINKNFNDNEIKLVIRSSNLNIFLMCFKSLLMFYPEIIKHLVVLVQNSTENRIYLQTGKMYGFEVKLIPSQDQSLYNNEWAKMLYESLQYNEVVSMDDDIIFIKSGIFDLLEQIQKETSAKILALKSPLIYDGKEIMYSHFFYKKDIIVSKNDFCDKKMSFEKYSGNDCALLGLKNYSSIYWIDEKINNKNHQKYTNFCNNDYYVHVGGISCLRNEIISGGENV